jgi:hypothetical protein
VTVPERDFKQRSRPAFDHQARDYDSAAYGRHARRLQADVLAAVETFALGAILQAILTARPGVRGVGVDLSAEVRERRRRSRPPTSQGRVVAPPASGISAPGDRLDRRPRLV